MSGKAACQKCAPGTHAVAEDRAACRTCPSGWVAGYGVDACDQCDEGKAANDEQTVCEVCAAGEYGGAVNDVLKCQRWPIGWFSDESGAAVCVECHSSRFRSGRIRWNQPLDPHTRIWFWYPRSR